MERQSKFYYQVSLPHYEEQGFLEAAVFRYKLFLHLKRINPQTFIAPTYDIDVVWHTHMSMGNQYVAYTQVRFVTV